MSNRTTLRELLPAVTPADMSVAMGIQPRLRWIGTRSWNEWTERERHIVATMFDALMAMSCAAAIRHVRRQQHLAGMAEVQDYLLRLVAFRNRFARRAWRRFAPFAC